MRRRVETRGNFEPLSDLLALPFFPLKSALPTLSAGCCGEIWTPNLPNVTLVAQSDTSVGCWAKRGKSTACLNLAFALLASNTAVDLIKVSVNLSHFNTSQIKLICSFA